MARTISKSKANLIMTKIKTFVYLIFLLMMPAILKAGIPAEIASAFKRLYPKASNPDWTLKGTYYVADFTSAGFGKEVWLNAKGSWIMSQTDLQTMDEAPASVYNTFVFGSYSNAPVTDVILAEFPKCPSVIVVKVGTYNMDTYYYLFYSLQGELLTTYNSDDFDGTLWPQVFDCH